MVKFKYVIIQANGSYVIFSKIGPIIESHILILKIAELNLQSLLPLWCEAVLIYISADFLLRTR